MKTYLVYFNDGSFCKVRAASSRDARKIVRYNKTGKIVRSVYELEPIA